MHFFSSPFHSNLKHFYSFSFEFSKKIVKYYKNWIVLGEYFSADI